MVSVVRVSFGRIWTLCGFDVFACNIDVPYPWSIREERMGRFGCDSVAWRSMKWV